MAIENMPFYSKILQTFGFFALQVPGSHSPKEMFLAVQNLASRKDTSA